VRGPSVRRQVSREVESSGRAHAGVGNQGRCPNGREDCRNGAGDTDAPCFDCVFGGADDGE